MAITDELRKYARHFSGIWYSSESNAFICTTGGIQPTTESIRMDEHILAIADRIDAEHERGCHEQYVCGAEHGIGASIEASMIQDRGYIELPKDADGEVIHIGDEMEYGRARGRVIALMLSNYPKKWGGLLHWGVQLEGEQAPTALDAYFRHYHEPTVEDVLREMLSMAGCKIHEDGSCEMGLTDEQIAEYAAKLRLAGDGE